jgi:hypothetical protein
VRSWLELNSQVLAYQKAGNATYRPRGCGFRRTKVLPTVPNLFPLTPSPCHSAPGPQAQGFPQKPIDAAELRAASALLQLRASPPKTPEPKDKQSRQIDTSMAVLGRGVTEVRKQLTSLDSHLQNKTSSRAQVEFFTKEKALCKKRVEDLEELVALIDLTILRRGFHATYWCSIPSTL